VGAPANVIESLDRGIDAALDDLAALARIPSVSARGFDAAHVGRSAEATADLLAKSGFDRAEVLTLPGAHPYAVAVSALSCVQGPYVAQLEHRRGRRRGFDS